LSQFCRCREGGELGLAACVERRARISRGRNFVTKA
jgi:hypothetical protein